MPTAIAIVDVTKLLPRYDSREEEAWAREGNLWVQSVLGQSIAVSFYHPLTFQLAGESYTKILEAYYTHVRLVKTVEQAGASAGESGAQRGRGR